MARGNRKTGPAGHATMVRSLVVFGVIAALAVVYLGLFNACEQIGRRIKALERQQAELRKQVVTEERNWEIARAINNVERLMAAHGIAMTWPAEQNIIRLAPEEPAEPARYARRDDRSARD